MTCLDVTVLSIKQIKREKWDSQDGQNNGAGTRDTRLKTGTVHGKMYPSVWYCREANATGFANSWKVRHVLIKLRCTSVWFGNYVPFRNAADTRRLSDGVVLAKKKQNPTTTIIIKQITMLVANRSWLAKLISMDATAAQLQFISLYRRRDVRSHWEPFPCCRHTAAAK